MKNQIISGGDSIEYESSVLLHLSSKTIPMKFRNENTDGKFMTNSEYIRHIRIKKLKKISDNNAHK